jgi:hypothetical protein
MTPILACCRSSAVPGIELPAALWRTLELAVALMNVDADLTKPPLWSE